MGKKTTINRKMLFALKNSSGASVHSSASLFDEADYENTQSGSENDFDRLYQGKKIDKQMPSAEEQYRRLSKDKKNRSSESESSIFEDVDYELSSPSETTGYDFEYLKIRTNDIEKSSDRKYIPTISAEVGFDSSVEYLSADIIETPCTDALDEKGQQETASSSTFSNTSYVKTIAVSSEEKRHEKDAEKIDRALAIAEDFAKREGLILLGGAIYRYNGRFYAMLSEDTAHRIIFEKYRKEICYASPAAIIRNVVTLLRYSIEKSLDEFPVNENLIIFENGTLEVDTGHFRKNSPDDFANSALGISYDPDRWKMPYTQHFLDTIADGDNDLYELMLQVIGYILSNDIRAKSFFYLEGVGDAGKSRFCDLIASFFPVSGPNKVARIALQDLGGKFALGNLVNTKLNISEDLPDNPLSPTTVSRIKMLSDSNRLEAEAKYVQPFSFKPMCKLLFASNHPLRIKEYDAAFINRVVYIPFLKAIPKEKQDKNILEKMQKELPALFNHAFQAYRRLVANGYEWAGADRFKPQICIVNSGISIDKELILRRFVDTCCVFEEDATISIAELQSAYELFCQNEGLSSIQGDRFSRELFAVLPDTVARVKIGNQKRGLRGLKLKRI